MTPEREEELMKIAAERFSDSLDLALLTNDDVLFQKILRAAHHISIVEGLGILVDKGLIEINTDDDEGFYFKLTEKGKKLSKEMFP